MKERKVRLFISSTFRDMNAERDYLNSYVFPQVKDYCRKRYIEFIPVDLRWGITEEESRNGLVLASCIQEVDNSRPFFIGILGARYGWMPTIEELNCNRPSIIENQEWLVSKLVESASITEIEMDYAVLRDKSIPYASFFIKSDTVVIQEQDREPVGSLAEQKLKQLKKKIRSQSKYPVHDYCEPKDIGDILTKELIEMISKEFPDDGNDLLNSITGRHETSLKRHAFSLFNVPNTERNMTHWGNNGYGLLLFTGPSGSGTSNALALSTVYMRNTYGSKILYYDFECASPAVDLFDDFMEFIKLDENQTDKNQWSMISIDNASLLDTQQTERMLEWLKNKPVNQHVIFAASYSLFADTMRMQRCDTITQNGLTHEMQYTMINNFVARYGKKLTEDQQTRIVKGAHSNDPTILSILLETLVNFGSMEKLDERIEHLVKESDYSLFADLTIEAETIFSKEDMALCFSKSLIGIAMHGDEGIAEQDLLDALNIPLGEWAVVKPMVVQFCHGNTLRLRFIQNSWRQDVKNRYSTPWISHIGYEMIEWWATQSHRIKEAATAISAIYLYIWHLPFDKNEEAAVNQKVLSVMLSPDAVLQLKSAYLSSLWHFVWQKDVPFSFEGYTIMGRDYYDLSDYEKENYYRKLAIIAESLGRSKDLAWCHRQIAHMHIGDNETQIEEAYALLAEGRAKEAIKTVTGFLTRISGNNKEKLRKRMIRAEAFLEQLSLDNMAEEIDHIFDLIEEMDEDEIFQNKDLINFYVQMCYQFSFRGVGDWLKMAINLVKKAIKGNLLEFISISNPIYYYFYMANVFICMKTSQFERMIKETRNALNAAFYAYGGSSYQYGRAHILYNYAYKKIHGVIGDGRSAYKNHYSLLPYKRKILDTLADQTVIDAIKQENRAYDALINDLGVKVSYSPHEN